MKGKHSTTEQLYLNILFLSALLHLISSNEINSIDLFFLVVLGMERKTSCTLGKRHATEPHTQAGVRKQEALSLGPSAYRHPQLALLPPASDRKSSPCVKSDGHTWSGFRPVKED